MTRERRQQTREVPAQLGFIQIGRDEGGRILNICEGGVSFETFAPIEREKVVQFWFSLNLRERIEATGKLAWLDEEKRVGGMRFVDLSAKARRHLRTNLGAQTGSDLILQVEKTGDEETPAKGSVFLAALAKQRLIELSLKPQTEESAAIQEPNSAAPHFEGKNTESERSRGQLSIESAPLNLGGLVSLEHHLSAGRRQFLRGVLVGAVFSLAIAVVAGKYFGRNQADSTASPGENLSAPAPASVGAPAMQATSGDSVPPGKPVSLTPFRTRQLPPSSYSPDNPPGGTLSSPSASPSDVLQQVPSRETEPHDGGEKAAKKSAATPQQLWGEIQAGNDKAAVVLADRYLHGDGVPVNCDQARVLLLVASAKKNAEAIKKLRELDAAGCPSK